MGNRKQSARTVRQGCVGGWGAAHIVGDGGTPPKWVVEGRQWGTWPNANIAAGIEQDDARLVVMCDQSAGRALHPDSRGLILIFLHEPRANWPKDARVAVMTTSDDGRKYSSPSYGIAIEINECHAQERCHLGA